MNPFALGSLVILLCLSQGADESQGTDKSQGEPKEPVKIMDHDSIDTLVTALYAVISGPKGQKRDWKRFASLFHEGAKLQAVVMGRDDKRRLISMTPQDYVKRSGKWAEENGLFERETHRTQDLYGHIVQIFSSYELRVGAEAGNTDSKAELTGINSIQCCQVDGKWRILSLLWEDTRSAGPIPAQYLAKPKHETPTREKGSKKDGDDRK